MLGKGKRMEFYSKYIIGRLNILSLYLLPISVIVMGSRKLAVFGPFLFFFSSVALYLIEKRVFFSEALKNLSKKEGMLLFSSMFFYIICLISLMISDDVSQGFSFLKETISLLLFPISLLFFSKNHITQKQIHRSLFLYVTTLLFIFVFFLPFLKIKPSFIPDSEIYSWEGEHQPLFFRHYLERVLRSHGGYLSLMLGMGLLILLYFVRNALKQKAYLKFGLAFVIIAFFLYIQGLLYARAALLLTTVACSLLIFFSRTSLLDAFIKMSLFVFIWFSVLVLSNSPIIKKIAETRILKILFQIKTQDSNNEDLKKMMISDRLRIDARESAYHLIKQSPIFGYGIGDFRNIFAKEIQPRSSAWYGGPKKDIPKHSHNNYLEAILIFGVLGFIGLCITYFFPIFYNRHILYLCFMFLIIGMSIIDTPLQSRESASFFAYFNSLLLLDYFLQKRKNDSSLKESSD